MNTKKIILDIKNLILKINIWLWIECLGVVESITECTEYIKPDFKNLSNEINVNAIKELSEKTKTNIGKNLAIQIFILYVSYQLWLIIALIKIFAAIIPLININIGYNRL